MEPFEAFMPQVRRAKERWPEAPTLARHYISVVESYDGSGHDLIASIRSFIECVCKTILGKFGKLELLQLESLQAAMKVALRRTLTKFGIEATRAEQTAEKLGAWLKTNAATLTETTPAE